MKKIVEKFDNKFKENYCKTTNVKNDIERVSHRESIPIDRKSYMKETTKKT